MPDEVTSDELLFPDDANQDTEPHPSGDHRTQRAPWLTWLACAACAAIFIGIHASDNPDSGESITNWGAGSPEDVYAGEVWVLVTSTFVHVAIWHLAFNVYWLWTFGSVIERELGGLRYLMFFVGAACVSSSCELAASGQTGIGMSGVVYAMMGLMWLARSRVRTFADVMNQQIVQLFLIWLVACVLLTYLQLLNVGNVAHFSGLLFGITTAKGFLVDRRPMLMRVALAVLIGASAISLVWCPWSVSWLSYKAYRAHIASNHDEAVKYYTRVIQKNPRDAWAYGNRSLVYRALGDQAAAAADEAAARTIDPSFNFE